MTDLLARWPLPKGIEPITKAGVYEIPEQRYHADALCAIPSLSAGMIKTLVRSTARHVWHDSERLNPNYEPPEDPSRFDAGSAKHAMLLGETHKIHVVRGFADWRKDAAKEQRQMARDSGLIPMLEHQMPPLMAMAKAVRAQIDQHEDLAHAFTLGKPEQTLVWFEGEGDDRIACRARLDWLHSGGVCDLIDLKTTATDIGEAWPKRTLFDIGGDIQDAWYRRGFRAVFGQHLRPRFAFCVVEDAEPFGCMFHALTPETQDAAEMKVEHAVNLWRWCMRHGAFPGWPRRTNWVDAPPWERAKAEEFRLIIRQKPAEIAADFQRLADWQSPIEAT